MRKVAQLALVVAALLGSANVSYAWDYGDSNTCSEEGTCQSQCSSYAQMPSNATGGDYVGGTLQGQVDRTTTTTTSTSSTGTVTTTVTASGGFSSTTVGGSAGGTVSGTSGTTTQYSETHTIGYYSMNDGSRYALDCTTGTWSSNPTTPPQA